MASSAFSIRERYSLRNGASQVHSPKHSEAMATSSMDTLLNIKAFLTTARAGSFSAAARQLGVAPSVITKRISRLEDQMDAKLFLRSTRQLLLTDVGERYLPRYQAIVGEVEEALSGAGRTGKRRRRPSPDQGADHRHHQLSRHHPQRLSGSCIPASPSRWFSSTARSTRSRKAIDVAIGALPASYANVIDEPLCPYPRLLCAAPDYLDRRGAPRAPARPRRP